MASLFVTTLQLSVLLAARRPAWARQLGTVFPNGAPISTTDGVFLQNSPKTLFAIDVREVVRARTSRITIRVLDLVGTYRVVVDGNNVDFDAAAAASTTELEVLQGWRDAINADATVKLIVAASLEDASGDGVDDTLKLVGIAEADYSMSTGAPVGAAELDLVLDPAAVEARIFFTHRTFATATDPKGDWHLANGAQYAVNQRNFVERLDTGGLDRAYVELFTVTAVAGDVIAPPHTLTYNPVVTIGPAILE